MPVKVLFEENCIINNKHYFSELGDKCLVVTGKSSAKLSGALDDIRNALASEGVSYEIFDEIMENPTFEILDKARNLYKDKGIDFVIGIGGGSPLDAAKMIAVLLKMEIGQVRDLLQEGDYRALPVVAVPTTSGTGSETTPYSIITDIEVDYKVTCKAKVFPKIAMIDVKYFMTMPNSVTKSTAIDALCHLSEGYLVVNSNLYSDELALSGLKYFQKAMKDLEDNSFTKEMHENLIHASTIAGMVISHSGTGIPHGMGYYLTMEDQVYHGKATGLFLASLVDLHLKRSPRSEKADRLLKILGFKDVEEFRHYILKVVGGHKINKELILDYAKAMSLNKRKLGAHDFEITYDDMLNAFLESLNIGC